jgi:hypothetical protein
MTGLRRASADRSDGSAGQRNAVSTITGCEVEQPLALAIRKHASIALAIRLIDQYL